MRTIITEKDIQHLQGNFIVEMNENKKNQSLFQDPFFWMEKRISFVTLTEGKVLLSGIFYTNRAITHEDFIERWNGKNERFLRLLTKAELHWLMDQLVERNLKNLF